MHQHCTHFPSQLGPDSLTRLIGALLLLFAPLLADQTAEPACAEAPPLTVLMNPESKAPTPMSPQWPKLQIDIKTMGGRQFWGDRRFFQGYRIQQNCLTGHCRLLDPRDIRRTWGSFADCASELDRIIAREQLPPMQGRAVVLLHGIGRSSKCFSKLAETLADQGVLVVGFDYPSTRVTMAESAVFLDETLSSLQGVDTIDLVGHSMGGLLVRAYLQAKGEARDPRLRRLVMMGTPNYGAEMADFLKRNVAFKLILGPAGQELVTGAESLIATFPIPDFEFGIIAGARGDGRGWNPLIPGDDDGTVSLDSTQLPGATDFLQVCALHSFLMFNPDVIDATTRFLETGCFQENGKRTPLPCPDAFAPADDAPKSNVD